MAFLKKWAGSAQLQAQTANGTRPRYLPDGPERGLPTLPNELIPAVLTRLDSRSLYCVAQVSRRFNEISTREWLARHGITPSQFSSGQVVIQSDLPGEAFAALRSALFLRVRPFTDLKCIMPLILDAKIIYQLDGLISWFSPPIVRLATTELDFGFNMIPHATSSRSLARALTKLVLTVTGDCPTTVFVLKDGLFTCRPDALRRWSPATGHYEGGWAESSYSTVKMHDESRQRVPSIRNLQTLSVKYPLNPMASAPFDKWKLVVVDASSLTDLQLSIKLAPHEWSAILGGLALPALVCVGLWAEAISTATSTRFFNRHPKIRTIKYMSPAADALPVSCAPLRLPRLESLNTLAPYLVHILTPPAQVYACASDEPADSGASSSSSSGVRFPRLAHIELRPHLRLREALLLVSMHTPLAALTLWSLSAAQFASPSGPTTWPWPPFPSVRRLTLNEMRGVMSVLSSGLPALLAHTFPALVRVEVNYAWAGRGDISTRQMEKEQRAFVEQVRERNPGVRVFLFDGKEYPV